MKEFYLKEKVRFNKGTIAPKLGDRFGKFTVTDERMYKTAKDNHNYVKVRCECGHDSIQPHSLLISKTRMGCCECYVKYRAKNYKVIGLVSSWYLGEVKAGAKSRNIEFNLTLSFLDKLYTKQEAKCALSGIDLILFPIRRGKNKSRSEVTASLDRIDNTKGYTEDNVQFVHKAINLMKGCLDNSEFINLCKYIANQNRDYKDNFEPNQINGAMKRHLTNTFTRRNLKGAETNG